MIVLQLGRHVLGNRLVAVIGEKARRRDERFRPPGVLPSLLLVMLARTNT